MQAETGRLVNNYAGFTWESWENARVVKLYDSVRSIKSSSVTSWAMIRRGLTCDRVDEMRVLRDYNSY
jgi:hypothetical protein